MVNTYMYICLFSRSGAQSILLKYCTEKKKKKKKKKRKCEYYNVSFFRIYMVRSIESAFFKSIALEVINLIVVKKKKNK